MSSKKASCGSKGDHEEIPAPEIDPVKTDQWLTVSDLRSLKPVEIAIMNNLEVIASQNRKILEILEALGETLENHNSSASSRSSSAASSAAILPDDGDEAQESQ